MKKFQVKIFIFGLLILLAGACKSIVAGLDVDPNNPADVQPELILTTLQLGDVSVHEGHTARVAGIWSGYFTGTARQYKNMQEYNAAGTTFALTWIAVFWLVFQQEKEIEIRSQLTGNRWLQGIARIVKAHTAGTATACWGDIPFAQAADPDQYPNPVFDPQKEVYEQVQNLLSSGIGDLASGEGSDPGGADIFLNGDSRKWIAAAHTLKARYFMETKDYESAYKEALLGISSASGSVLAPHSAAFGSQNFYSYGVSVTDMTSQDAYITRLLDRDSRFYRGNDKTDETARFRYYFTYTLMEDGKTKLYRPNTLNTTTGKGIFAQNASFSLITFQENQLILAEAGVRTKGFSTGLSHLNVYRQFLNAGGYLDPTYVTDGNHTYAPYVPGDFDGSGLLNTSALSVEQALLKEVLLERYITFFGQKTGFSDLRRTREEQAGVKVPLNTGDRRPQRFVYSLEEINANTSAPNPVPDIFQITPVNE